MLCVCNPWVRTYVRTHTHTHTHRDVLKSHTNPTYPISFVVEIRNQVQTMRLGNGRALLSLTLTWHKAVFSQCTRPCSRRAGKPHITSPMSPPLRWELQTEAGAGTLQEGTNRKERPPVKRRQTFRVHVYASKHAHTHVHTHTHACTHTRAHTHTEQRLWLLHVLLLYFSELNLRLWRLRWCIHHCEHNAPGFVLSWVHTQSRHKTTIFWEKAPPSKAYFPWIWLE